MQSTPKPKSQRQLRKEREALNRSNEAPDALSMQTAKTWVGWEARGKRARYCLMGEPD
jgi:hypothetical protein